MNYCSEGEVAIKEKIKALQKEIDSLKSKLNDENESGDGKPPSEPFQFDLATRDTSGCPSNLLSNEHEELEHAAVEVADLSFPTATDALASEAQFMESIGLTLNPRWSKPASHRERSTSDCLEASELLLWCDQGSSDLPSFVESPMKNKSQNSLLSFLNKSKSVGHQTTPTEDKDDFLRSDEITDDADETIGSSTTRWRLWQPEQEGQMNDELWTDLVFSSAAEYIAYEEAAQEEVSSHAVADNALSNGDMEGSPSEGSLPHHCQPCKRSLSSRESFYRHTLSELHFKRTSTIAEIPDAQPRQRFLALPAVVETLLPETAAGDSPQSADNKDKSRQKTQECQTCHARIPDGCIGKHMVSHLTPSTSIQMI